MIKSLAQQRYYWLSKIEMRFFPTGEFREKILKAKLENKIERQKEHEALMKRDDY